MPTVVQMRCDITNRLLSNSVWMVGGSNLSSQRCQKVDGHRMYEMRVELPWPSGYSSAYPWLTDHSMESENPTRLNLSLHGRLPTCKLIVHTLSCKLMYIGCTSTASQVVVPPPSQRHRDPKGGHLIRHAAQNSTLTVDLTLQWSTEQWSTQGDNFIVDGQNWTAWCSRWGDSLQATWILPLICAVVLHWEITNTWRKRNIRLR